MRTTAFSALLAAGLLLTSCGQTPQASSAVTSGSVPVSAPPAISSSAAASAASQSAEPDWPADDFSALPADVQSVFTQAQAIYNYFELSPPACDGEPASVNGQTVYHVSTGAYADYAAFYSAVLGSFTEDYAQNELFGREEYLSLDGALYTLVTGRDPNSTFRWASAQITAQTDTQLSFTVTAHYYEGYLPEGQRESTKNVDYTAVKTDAGWRFSQFGGYL